MARTDIVLVPVPPESVEADIEFICHFFPLKSERDVRLVGNTEQIMAFLAVGHLLEEILPMSINAFEKRRTCTRIDQKARIINLGCCRYC